MKPELLSYLQQRAKQGFDIKNNNCVQFTNKCWEIQHGHPWCGELNQYFDIKQTKWDDPIEAANTILQRVEKPAMGDLVGMKLGNGHYYLKGYICGFCIGDLSVFLGDKGLKYLPTKRLKLFWRDKNVI